MDLAEVLRRSSRAIDAAVVQVDEANLPGRPRTARGRPRRSTTCSPASAARRRSTSASATTAARRSRRASSRPAAVLQRPGARPPVLEFARRGYDELEVFRDLKPSIALGIGVIDIKDNEVETPDGSPGGSSGRSRRSGPSGSAGSIPTAASGCCSGASPTARCGRWSKAATCSKEDFKFTMLNAQCSNARDEPGVTLEH